MILCTGGGAKRLAFVSGHGQGFVCELEYDELEYVLWLQCPRHKVLVAHMRHKHVRAVGKIHVEAHVEGHTWRDTVRARDVQSRPKIEIRPTLTFDASGSQIAKSSLQVTGLLPRNR